MNFLRNQQRKLRRELYKGLVNACSKGQAAGDIGKAFVLPSTHQGSPRQMLELYQDAMAIVCKFGKPDLFLTFTCNPKWREIQENLFVGQTAWDRPDLICRVFKLKLDEFLDDLFKKQIFGKVKAAVHVIEFQKRGLPHCHCLIILEEEDKFKTAQQIDRCIRAEIPDKNKNPVLFERVLKHMIHMPCRSKFRKCTPGRGGQCNKRFPKTLQDLTTISEEGYPLYQRRKHPAVDYSYGKAELSVDNRYVVPYNPYLLMKYNGHINVELCNTITAVKYLYKYIYKGWDKAIAELNSLDEITKYENCRYVSSIEAFWRMKENFRMHGRFPFVERLPIHVEDGEEIVFEEDAENLEDLKERLKKDTKLTAWFKLNSECSEFKGVKYFEISKYCTWNSKDKKWVKRKRNKLNANQTRSEFDSENKIYEDVVVRTNQVAPQDSERFYLKTLLLNKPGASSFKALRTVKGKIYDTFQEAVAAMGLLDDDQIWIDTLNEATIVQCNPVKLVRLFSHMLINSPMHEPGKLWDQFKGALTKNFRKGLSEQECEREALIFISRYLFEFDKKLSDFQLPEVQDHWHGYFERIELNEQDLLTNEQQFKRLTAEQRVIFGEVKKRLEKRAKGDITNDNLMFVDAPGGTGKTFMLNVIIKSMLSADFKVLAVAHTGVAATLLHNGRTAHSTFKLPLHIGDGQTPVCDIKRGTKLAEFLKSIDLIVFDEISMTSNRTLACLERTLRDLCCVDSPFANKLMLFSGDFRQILPIVELGTREEITGQIVKNTQFWHLVKKFYLTKNLRLGPGQEQFAQHLLDIGEDRIEKNEHDEAEVEPNLIFKGNLSDFVDFFYGKTMSERDYDQIQNIAILTPLNEDVHRINRLILEKLDSEERVYFGLDTICKEQASWCVPTELLNKINQCGLPLQRLELKTGAIASLLRNIDQSMGICNGTKVVIKELADNLITVEVLTGKAKGATLELPRFVLPSDEKQGLRFTRRQFPIRLAFASSIHKAQGQSYDKVGIYIKDNFFSHGHRYVAWSRVRLKDNIKVLFDDPERTTARNIVYPEVFDEEHLQRSERQVRVPKKEPIEDSEQHPEFDQKSEPQAEPKREPRNLRSSSRIEKFGITLNSEDLNILDGHRWFNDNIINFYFKLLQERYDQTFSFSCFLNTSIENHGQESVRNWNSNVDIFVYKLVFVPINTGSHWTLIVINFEAKKIEYFNSYVTTDRTYLDRFWEYLKAEHRRKRNLELIEDGWKLEIRKRIPRQSNSFDCGPFVCRYGLTLCQNKQLNFTEDTMDAFRKDIKRQFRARKLD